MSKIEKVQKWIEDNAVAIATAVGCTAASIVVWNVCGRRSYLKGFQKGSDVAASMAVANPARAAKLFTADIASNPNTDISVDEVRSIGNKLLDEYEKYFMN